MGRAKRIRKLKMARRRGSNLGRAIVLITQILRKIGITEGLHEKAKKIALLAVKIRKIED